MVTHHAPPTVATGSFEGVDSIELAGGGYTATFLPELGMLGASLTFDGHEYLSLHGGVDRYREHHTTGLPLLYPWANRLSGSEYLAAGVDVVFVAEPPVVVLDGIPIHGTMNAVEGWQVERTWADDTMAVLEARFAFTDHLAQMASFPFAHGLALRMELGEAGLRVRTAVHATGAEPVPISFGWHPYLALPGVERRDVSVVLPPRVHVLLDRDGFPTGTAEHEGLSTTVLGDGADAVSFDDSYRLDRTERWLAIEGPAPDGRGRVRVLVELDDGYPFAQVYAPADAAFVALEPMTAPIDALVSGDHRVVLPGESSSASFTIRVQLLD